MFKDARARAGIAKRPMAGNPAVGAYFDHFAWFDLAHEFGTDHVERHAFAGKDSGIADPAPIAHHALTPGFDLDGIVVLLDAETVRRRERHPVVGRTIRRQLAAADVLVLNKIDLVSAGQLAELDAWLAHAAPGVPVVHARDGLVPAQALTGVGHDAPFETEPPTHEHDYATVSVTFDQPITRAELDALLDGLPPGVLRVKGIVQLADSPGRRTVVHQVASRRAISTAGDWTAGESGRLVVIALAGTVLDGLVGR